MSKLLATVVETPSYGETQSPDVAVHALSVTTLVPSRIKTVSRVSHFPEMVSHNLNAERAYAGLFESTATVNCDRYVFAVAVLTGVGRARGSGAAMAAATTARNVRVLRPRFILKFQQSRYYWSGVASSYLVAV